VSDPKFLASVEKRRDLCTVNNVLAWKAGDVRARPADVFPIDDCDALAFASKCAMVEPVPPPRITRSK
jgi:hypothetical protein